MVSGNNTPTLKIAIAQIDPTVGDIGGNAEIIRRARTAAGNADLVVTPELALSGYPPEDLVLRPGFLDRIESAVNALAHDTLSSGPAILLGTPWRHDGAVYNSALLLDRGQVTATFKHHLPNYGVFDEKRVFTPGPLPLPLEFMGVKLGIAICEDMWFSDIAANLAENGAQMLIVPNGSPYEIGKREQRLRHAWARHSETGLSLLYVNQVGGQDELVFDGASFLVADRQPYFLAPAFESFVGTTEWREEGETLVPVYGVEAKSIEGLEEIYSALILALRDYVGKNGFPGVILGLSGGIDSALCAAIAVDALGAEKVHAVMMPSPYTSRESLEDAAACAGMLGIRLDTLPIDPGMAAAGQMLGELPGIAGENIQSRLRGLSLMALSNRDGAMVLSTGNKSEMAVGYATLYGDMCGGYAILKDVYKTQVFALSRWRNEHVPAISLASCRPAMPERIITKPPSAELKPGQTDQDTLPPYDLLDAILVGLIEEQGNVDGLPPETVEKVWRMLDRAEYKRRQAPPGAKITRRSFGRERRYPITNGFGPDIHG
jgi:NAD+ synthase